MHNRIGTMILRVFILSILLLPAASTAGQTLETLRLEVQRAEEEIRKTSTLLSKTRSDKTVSQNQLKLIQNRIRNRRQIVDNLSQQAALVRANIDSKSDTVKQFEHKLAQLRQAYGRMVYITYKHHKTNDFMAFLFSARDFHDAVRRISYLRSCRRALGQKALEIRESSQLVNRQIEELRNQQKEFETLQKTRHVELESLGKDEAQYKNTLTSLSQQESTLSTRVKTRQAELNRLQQQIQNIIAEEARKNRNTPRTAAQQEYIANLSGRFDQNKGKLPYPLPGGVIIDHYGIHPHPTQRGLMVNNKGVTIAGNGGGEVRAVFEGEVSRIFFLQGMNNSVMIRHGNYITLYANLSTVSVKAGDKVAINQEIGRLPATGDSDDHVLQFQIWKETENLNPEPWLRH